MHHQWARQEFSPARLSACKASILLRKTARAVVRSARRTLFAPRFRSRSIVAPAHKPATIFSDQSPRDEHERLREVRVRPEGNGATKKPQHSLRLFLVHHRGLSRGLRNAALWRSLRHCVPPPCSRHPMVHQIEPSLKDCNKKRAAISCNAYFGAPSGTRTQDPLIKSQLLSLVARTHGYYAGVFVL